MGISSYRILIVLLLFLIALMTNYVFIAFYTASLIYTRIDKLPACDTALLLGTSKVRSGGRVNIYFDNRIRATAELYHAGKIQKIIASGDNRKLSHQEVDWMEHDLVEMGIPDSAILRDNSAYRTWNSMRNAKYEFNQNRLIVISQEFHLQRALTIGRSLGMEVYGYAAEEPFSGYLLKNIFRELLARVKMWFDILIPTGKSTSKKISAK